MGGTSEQRAKIDEPLTIKSEKDFLRNVLLILKRKQQISQELTIADIDVKITRNKTDNMLVKAQALIYLLEKELIPRLPLKHAIFGGTRKRFTCNPKNT